MEINARGREVEEEQDDNEDDGARLDVARPLRLRHPGGLHLSHEAVVSPAVGAVPAGLLVRVAGDVLGRQRDRRAPHRESGRMQAACRVGIGASGKGSIISSLGFACHSGATRDTARSRNARYAN